MTIYTQKLQPLIERQTKNPVLEMAHPEKFEKFRHRIVIKSVLTLILGFGTLNMLHNFWEYYIVRVA